MSEMKKQTVAILFSDIKGYSSLNLKQKIALREFVEPNVLDAVIGVIDKDSIKYFNS